MEIETIVSQAEQHAPRLKVRRTLLGVLLLVPYAVGFIFGTAMRGVMLLIGAVLAGYHSGRGR